MSCRPIFRTMEQHTFLIIYRGGCNKTGICIALSHFERVTINRFQKITVCQRFPNFSNIFPNFSQLEKLLKTNHIDPIVSMMNPARKAEFPTASDWFGSHVAPRKNSTSVGFFAYIADYQRITYAPSVVNFQTMSAQM